jgi:aminopeptidase N
MISNLPPGVSDNDPHINPPDDDPEMKTPFEIRQRIQFLHKLLLNGPRFAHTQLKEIQTEIETLQWVLGENQE